MYSFQIIKRVMPDSIFLTAASTADTTTVSANGDRTLLANCVSRIFINGKRTFINGSKILPRNPPNYTLTGSCVLDNKQISNDELFAEERYKATPVLFFIPDLNLMS